MFQKRILAFFFSFMVVGGSKNMEFLAFLLNLHQKSSKIYRTGRESAKVDVATVLLT